MNVQRYHLGLAPTRSSTAKATLLCKLQNSIPSANMRPPMNIIFVSYALIGLKRLIAKHNS